MIPGGAVHPGDPRERLRRPLDRSELAVRPVARVAACRQPADVDLDQRQARGPGVGIERVAVLGAVGDRHRRDQVRRGERPRPENRLAGRVLERGRRPGRVEDTGGPGQPETDEVEERRLALQLLERGARLLRARGRPAERAAVDEHEPREALGPRLAVEVPARVRGRDRAAQRVPSEDDAATLLARRLDDPADVVDRDVHPPLARERHRALGHRLEVRADARVVEPAQVVVEQLPGVDLPGDRAIEHRVVLEQVLAAFDRPHLIVGQLIDDRRGERPEVGGAARGPGDEDEDVVGLLAPLLQHLDLVQLRRRSRRREAAHRRHPILGARRGRREQRHRDESQRDQGRSRPASHLPLLPLTHSVPAAI